MNPTLLRKSDLIKCYNAITGTKVSDELTREEMEEHLLWLKKFLPIETHVAMQATLSDDHETLVRVLRDIDKVAQEVAVAARESSGIIIKDNSRFGELIIEKPVVKSPVKTYGYGQKKVDRNPPEVIEFGETWVLLRDKYQWAEYELRSLKEDGTVHTTTHYKKEEAMKIAKSIIPPPPEPIYEEDFVTLETGMKWIH